MSKTKRKKPPGPPVRAGVIVGVDPGDHCGVAFMCSGLLHGIHSIRGSRLASISAVFKGLLPLADDHGGAVVVVENQFGAFHGPGKRRINIPALGTLFRRRHEWEILAEIYKVPTATVYPSSWQTQLAAASRSYQDGSPRSTKARAILVCGQLWPSQEGWTEDTADAALIARWYWQQQIAHGVDSL